MSEVLNNKYEFHPFMWSNGFAEFMPELYKARIGGEVIPYSKIRFPCICKPIIGRGGVGVYIANNESELKNEARDEIIEEYIPGTTEYCGHFNISNGVIMYSIYFKAEYEGIKVGDMANFTIAILDNQPFESIFKKLNYSGYACANFKITDKVKIFEINPRIGGSILNDREHLKKLQTI